MSFYRTKEQLEAGLSAIMESPADKGTLEMIVSRPSHNNRVVQAEGFLDKVFGLKNDNWKARGNSRMKNGVANPDAQLTLMNARAIDLMAGSKDRWPLAGDQLYVDLDLSIHNLKPGSVLNIGESLLEITSLPHTGCRKFIERYGKDAMIFVNSKPGMELRLRGVYAKVIKEGNIMRGDMVRVLTIH